MQPEQRRDLIVDALRRIEGDAGRVAIFTDRGQPDTYVQMTGDGIVEVTSREYGDNPRPLDYFQMMDLADMGFDPTPNPNYRRDGFPISYEAFAAECERFFAIMGSDAAFELDVEVIG